MNLLPDGWQAVAIAAEINKTPRRILLAGLPVVLFRSGQTIAALHDRCPHRHVELSKGKVENGEIECPYHGWRFKGTGACTAIPGLTGAVPSYRVPRLKTVVKEGVVFVARGDPEAQPYLHCAEGQKIILKLVGSSTRSTLVDTAENILDATHTHFTHKGLLRGLSSERQRVRVDISGGPGWVEACYTGEERQHGLISRLLEGERVKTIGRFRHPGIAELEYWGAKGLVLATTFHLRQATENQVDGIGCLIGPRGGLLDHLKSFAFRPMFRFALEQDRRVLTSASQNAAYWPEASAIVGPLDFLRRSIEAIIAGAMPPAADSPETFYIEL
ncbi:Rieske (2Fe-2S) protein [Rhizobium anhuiense]|uniref:Rieske (2Fe-2S) protein n=1 Tax=Rhizobium anhuiense TaxID=1184720 RepID=UPI0014420AEB|nr:Rieske (2Fe-2S) protein [Rhizobium anhuiense]NKM58526.1 Rieske 2Fe-2S domain-containing protein [Rhizobium anhuiense]UTS88214.1 Rieske (2Fe-2S) protein [Rhizobium anhuiense bv. trifolii]